MTIQDTRQRDTEPPSGGPYRRRPQSTVAQLRDVAICYRDKAMGYRYFRQVLCAIAGVVAVALVVGVITSVNHRRGLGRVDAAAAQLAADLAAGTVPAGLTGDNAPDEASFARLLEGMGDLPHSVEVVERGKPLNDNEFPVRLRHAWQIQPDKDPWVYDVDATLVKVDGQWLPQWTPELLAPGLQSGERIRAIRLRPMRGEIRGDGSAPIVSNRQVQRIGLDKARLDEDQYDKAAKKMAEPLGLDVAAFTQRVHAGGPQAFVEAAVVRPGDPLINMLGARNIPGMIQVPDTMSMPPTDDFAPEILGRTGEPTAELIAASNGVLKPQDVVGLSGVQQHQNDMLQGTVGYTVQAVNIEDPNRVRDLLRVKELNGSPLHTTLNVQMQKDAEQVMSGVASDASLVAISASTGGIVAIANSPGSQGAANSVTGLYAPGSTWKVVTALAMLRQGKTPESLVSCPAKTTVDGREFGNHSKYPASKTGQITLTDALAFSCNTAFVEQAHELTWEQIQQAAGALGLTQTPHIGVPAEIGRLPENPSGTAFAAAQIGQGEVMATPLGMATMMASVAAGRPVAPTLLADEATGQPSTDQYALTPQEAEQLRTMMGAAVTEGTASMLQGLRGDGVWAKSGTAEYGDATPPATHAWLVAGQGDLVVVVFVADGHSGSRTAGPLVKRFLKYHAR